ncbi:MAG TPA: ribonuclease BN [Micrococcales bacterium]|nr:ribonuclease BN [Micrococcales bacterium]
MTTGSDETTTTHAPDPDDPRKPDSPDDLTSRSWKYVLRTTVREFQEDQCTDLAAALTYYAVLAIAPALLALTSILGLVGDPEEMVTRVMDLLEGVLPPEALASVQPIIENLTQAPAAGFAFVIGLVTALWSASGYVAAFSRGMNRVYEVEEGRPIWKLRPQLLLVTLALLVIAAVIVAALVLSGDVARSVGSALGLSDVTVTVWNILKWPLVLALVVLAVALLYHQTPNVRQPTFRWVSVGALAAILVWVLASVGFALYVSRFASYDSTYGSLAGVIILLLALWIMNLALLFGAELDSELERGRELQAGIPAERDLQLPARDTKAAEKRAAKAEADVARGRALRVTRGESSDAEDAGVTGPAKDAKDAKGDDRSGRSDS